MLPMAQKQYSRSIARLVLVAGMCFTAIGLCSVSASAIDNTELLQPVAIKEDSLQPIGQSVLLADVSEENWYEGTSGSLYYCYADGTYATGITTLPNEETYLFALDGTLKTGWQTIDGVRYYFDLTTGQKQFGWISHSNRLYYVFPETGKQVGEAVIDGTPYVFDEFGVLQTGIYTCEDGTIAGCAEDATPYTGFVTDETSQATYYFNENGIAQTGWQIVDGATYYLGEDGVLRTGLTSIDDSVYDFGTDGVMQTGLVTMEDGTVLFFGADGKQAMGLQTVDGKTYYFNDLGMAVNTKQTIDGKTYYFGADGSMQTGLVTLNKDVYYFGKDGNMQTGFVTMEDGTVLFFGADGKQATEDMIVHLTSASSSGGSDGTRIESQRQGVPDAMRISFTEADISVYDPGLGDTSTPIDGGKQFGLPSGGTVTYNNGNALFSLKANEDKPVVVRVWLEGTDPACNDSIRNADFKIWLRFIGTDENGNPLIDQRNEKHRTGN